MPYRKFTKYGDEVVRPNLAIGSLGNDVLLLQQWVATVGFPPTDGKIDGVYGQHTAEAVAMFQNANGISPTGEVGPDTWAKLESIAQPDFGPAGGAKSAPVKVEFGPVQILGRRPFPSWVWPVLGAGALGLYLYFSKKRVRRTAPA